MNESLYDIPLKNLDGQLINLGEFKKQVLLIVNVASRCGLTSQYAGLEKLFETYHERGLQVLGFPCNDFAAQEPGSADDIKHFCTLNYGVQFPMFDKININSEPRHPLYVRLTKVLPKAVNSGKSELHDSLAQHGLLPKQPADVMWNFEKFLVGRDGQVLSRFAPDISTDDPMLIAAIEAALS